MDLTDEEIGQLLGERLYAQPQLLSHARVELAKAPSGDALKPATAALFVARICVLIQHVRGQLPDPSECSGWITKDRLRTLFLSACGLGNPDIAADQIEHAFQDGLDLAGSNTWLQCERIDEWRPGMRSGSGWVWKFSATPLGRQKVQRADGPPQELVVAPKPAPEAPKNPPWGHSSSRATAQAVALVKNDVSIAPQIIVNVHVPPHPPASSASSQPQQPADDLDDEAAIQTPVKFPMPEGYHWEDMLIVIMAHCRFKILVGRVKETYHMRDAGLADTRKELTTGNTSWELLVILAEDQFLPGRAGKVSKKNVSLLRDWLRDFTGLRNDPFQSYQEGRGWVPKFKIKRGIVKSCGLDGRKSHATFSLMPSTKRTP